MHNGWQNTINQLALEYNQDYPNGVVFDSRANMIFYGGRGYVLADFVGITLQKASKLCQNKVFDITESLQNMAKKREAIAQFRDTIREVSQYATNQYNADKSKTSIDMNEKLTITGSAYFTNKSLADYAVEFQNQHGYDPFDTFKFGAYPTSLRIVSQDDNKSSNDFDNFSTMAANEDSNIAQDIRALNFDIKRLAEQATNLDKGARKAITSSMASANKMAGGF